MQKSTIHPTRLLLGSALLLFISFAFVGLATAAGPQCASPFVQVQDSAPAANDPAGTYAIQRINMGEPFISCSQKKLTVIMKVPTMDPGASGTAHPPPDGIWRVLFKIPASANSYNTEITLFVEFNSTLMPQGIYDFGWIDPATGSSCSQCSLNVGGVCANTGVISPDGTITMTLSFSSTLTFGSCASTPGPDMTITPAQWAAGTQLTDIQGVTQVVLQPVLVGGVANLTYINQASTPGDGTYTVLGNLSCSNPPLAGLAANVNSGNAPLTVNFDAASSSVPAGGCGPINTYIFDFGDGSQVTQATPAISHIYTTGGATYAARVRVKTTSGITSSNIAQQDIAVNSAGPPLVNSIVSRLTHGLAGAFDVVLPQPPATRAVECRNGGGNYKMVFTFLNNVVSVASASVTGTGSVGSAVLGPNTNQYTVNLAGVSNAQSVTVTLNTALDSSGASGNVTGILGVLIGDASGNGSVNSSDIGQVKAQSGASTLTASNFRTDVTVNGTVNSSDIGTAKANSGTSLP